MRLMLAAMEFALYLELSGDYLDTEHATMGLTRLTVLLRDLNDQERDEFLAFLSDQAEHSTGRVAEVIRALPATLALRTDA